MVDEIRGITLRTLTPEEQAEHDRIREEQAPAQLAAIQSLIDAAKTAAPRTKAKAPDRAATVVHFESPLIESRRIERVIQEARERDRKALAEEIAAAMLAQQAAPVVPVAAPPPSQYRQSSPHARPGRGTGRRVGCHRSPRP